MNFYCIDRVTFKNYTISRCFLKILREHTNERQASGKVVNGSNGVAKGLLSFHFMLIWKHHLEALTMGHSGRLHMLDTIRMVDKAYRLLCLGAACSHSFCATDSACSSGVAPRVLTVGEAKGNS